MRNFLATKGYAGDVDQIDEVDEYLNSLSLTDVMST
jgi:hypothetical protein